MHRWYHSKALVDCRELWDGPRAGTDDTVQFTGVDEVSDVQTNPSLQSHSHVVLYN